MKIPKTIRFHKPRLARRRLVQPVLRSSMPWSTIQQMSPSARFYFILHADEATWQSALIDYIIRRAVWKRTEKSGFSKNDQNMIQHSWSAGWWSNLHATIQTCRMPAGHQFHGLPHIPKTGFLASESTSKHLNKTCRKCWCNARYLDWPWVRFSNGTETWGA